VQVEMSLKNGEVTLALHAVDERAQDVLRAALQDLRASLQQAGLTATQVTVDGGRGDDGRDAQQERSGGSSADHDPDGDAAPTLPASLVGTDPDAALDLRM
jgi:flagellar hook-length control protein FliK